MQTLENILIFFQRTIVSFDFWIKNRSLYFLKSLLFTRTTNFKHGKILIFRTGSIGDSICAFPAFHSIRKNYPDSEIYILTNPGAKNVSLEYLLDPTLGFKILNYNSLEKRKLFKMLKELKIDLFIELPQTLTPWKNEIRNMIIAKMIGAKFGFGWKIISTKIFKHYQEHHHEKMSVTQILLEILKQEGLETNDIRYPLALSQDIYNKVDKEIESFNLHKNNKLVAVIVGAKRSTNRWPIEYFMATLQDLEQNGFSFLFIGGEGDSPLVQPLLLLKNTFDFTGKLTPLESAYLMSKCMFTLSNDTGPMHLSYAVGTPVISIFSARDYPYLWFPPDDGLNRVLRSWQQKCSICLIEECPNKNACLFDINPSMVVKEIEGLYNTINQKIQSKKVN